MESSVCVRSRSGAAIGVAVAILAGAQILDAQADAPASVWSRSAQISANAWYGAARSRVVATELSVSRSDSTSSVRSDLTAGYADDRPAGQPRRVTARAMRVSLGIDYHPFARWSPFGFGSVESNYQQRIAQRYSVGVGAKLTLLRKDRDDLSVSLAILGERTRALPQDNSAALVTERARWSLRPRYRRQLTPSVFISHVTFYQPAIDAFTDRYITDSNTTIEAALTSVLSLTATHRHRYDSEAEGRGAESNVDGQLLFGVRARF